MRKLFRSGLVVGKFAPLHLGHEHLINHAIEQCEQVILLSWSLPEIPGFSAEQTEKALSLRYPMLPRWVITDQHVKQWQQSGLPISDLPANNASDQQHRQFIAEVCIHICHVCVDALFSAEDYGDGCALSLSQHFSLFLARPHTVQHIRLPRLVKQQPISATLIRQSPYQYRDLLDKQIYGQLIKRIVLLGGESSGKSTLAHYLADYWQTEYVAEYGREHWQAKQGELVFSDLLHIAQVQVERETQASYQAKQFLFCDTSPLTTLLYSQYLFQQVDPTLQQLAQRSYDLVLLCAPDIPFEQDGTRVGESFRQYQHQRYLDELEGRNITYYLVTGDLKKRLDYINSLLGLLI